MRDQRAVQRRKEGRTGIGMSDENAALQLIDGRGNDFHLRGRVLVLEREGGEGGKEAEVSQWRNGRGDGKDNTRTYQRGRTCSFVELFGKGAGPAPVLVLGRKGKRNQEKGKRGWNVGRTHARKVKPNRTCATASSLWSSMSVHSGLVRLRPGGA